MSDGEQGPRTDAQVAEWQRERANLLLDDLREVERELAALRAESAQTIAGLEAEVERLKGEVEMEARQRDRFIRMSQAAEARLTEMRECIEDCRMVLRHFMWPEQYPTVTKPVLDVMAEVNDCLLATAEGAVADE